MTVNDSNVGPMGINLCSPRATLNVAIDSAGRQRAIHFKSKIHTKGEKMKIYISWICDLPDINVFLLLSCNFC